jgi:hypothetical protein
MAGDCARGYSASAALYASAAAPASPSDHRIREEEECQIPKFAIALRPGR